MRGSIYIAFKYVSRGNVPIIRRMKQFMIMNVFLVYRQKLCVPGCKKDTNRSHILWRFRNLEEAEAQLEYSLLRTSTAK